MQKWKPCALGFAVIVSMVWVKFGDFTGLGSKLVMAGKKLYSGPPSLVLCHSKKQGLR